MSWIPRLAARRDRTEPAIVAALEAAGARVWPLSAKGIPDLLCRIGSRYFLVECKSPGGKLEGVQVEFAEDAAHHRAPMFVVFDPAVIPGLVKQVREWNRDGTGKSRR